MITPGSGNLYIAFAAKNTRTTGYFALTLTIQDSNGNVLVQSTTNVAPNGYGSVEYTGNMPTGAYQLGLIVNP